MTVAKAKLFCVVTILIVLAVVAAGPAQAFTQTRLDGPLTGRMASAPDSTCPPNFMGLTPQERVTITGVVHDHAGIRERLTASACANCCHPGGYGTTTGWAILRVGRTGVLAGTLISGGGGWWGFSFSYRIFFTTPGLRARVGQTINVVLPYAQTNNVELINTPLPADPPTTVTVTAT